MEQLYLQIPLKLHQEMLQAQYIAFEQSRFRPANVYYLQVATRLIYMHTNKYKHIVPAWLGCDMCYYLGQKVILC